MAEVVYILCAVTALACATLLARAYTRSRQPLLLWSALCFAGLVLTNGTMFVDIVVVPNTDLHWVRSALGLASTLLLLVGLVWEAP